MSQFDNFQSLTNCAKICSYSHKLCGFLIGESMSVEIGQSPQHLLNFAIGDAIDRSSKGSEAVMMIKNALKWRLEPYIIENWELADQLQSLEYQNFARGIKNYLVATMGFVVCPDGRIVALSLGDPLVANINRRLQGMPLTRFSTRDRTPALNDPDLAASITYSIESRLGADENPEIIEAVGPHILSTVPEEGCGAAKNKIIESGRYAKLGMRFGGISDFFNELGERFYSFDHNAGRAGGVGTTFDWVHDAHSEGAIVGLRDHYRDFDTTKTMRENLLRLDGEGKIVMTESLEAILGQRISELAISKGVTEALDVKKASDLIFNATTIGNIAQEIAIEQEKEGFGWIPNGIKKDKTEASLRVIAYHLIRNRVYLDLAHIRTGHHDLLKHPETLVSVGPTSALYNRENIPFVQKTPTGQFSNQDVQDTFMLYGLASTVMEERGVDLTREGRIVLVTGEYDKSLYNGNSDGAKRELERVASIVRNNAAQMREKLAAGIATGEAIVLGCLHEPETRKLIAVV